MVKFEMRKLKFTKFSTTEIPSFPGAIDIVFYKDENNGLYRLRYVDQVFRDPSPIMSLQRMMCVSKYAPEIIEGEAIRENSDEVHVKIENDIYVLQKNEEKLKFWDGTDNFFESDKKDTSALQEVNNKEMQEHNQMDFIKEMREHNKRLEKILEKLAEK